MNTPGKSSATKPSHFFSRRTFLRAGGGFSLAGVVTGILGHYNAGSAHYRHEPIDAGISELDGLRLLFPTDLHVGGNINELVHEVNRGIHMLLHGSHPGNTVVMHGGDFVSKKALAHATPRDDMKQFIPPLLQGLECFTNVGVIGNHDDGNPDFKSYLRGKLEGDKGIKFFEKPDQKKLFEYNGKKIAFQGIHTLSSYLKYLTKEERNEILDEYIRQLNDVNQDINICLLHSPDGLEFLLQRLRETGQKVLKKTYFFAGHTHGGMFDIPGLRTIGLDVCNVEHGRYKGWYSPEGDYSDTGDWKMYVSTGVGNSPYHSLRLNADPEVVCFEFQHG